MTLFLLISSTALISFVVSSSKLFEPFRKLLEPVPFIGQHIKCGICFGIPVALVLNLIYGFDFLYWLTTAFWSGCLWCFLLFLIGVKDVGPKDD